MNDFVVATCSLCLDELLVSEHAPEYRTFPFVCPECKAEGASDRGALEGARFGPPGDE